MGRRLSGVAPSGIAHAEQGMGQQMGAIQIPPWIQGATEDKPKPANR